jgi:peptide/nickel transport system ATP-binding protein
MNAIDTSLAHEATATDERMPLLSVDRLTLEFATRAGTVHALQDVSFALFKGETVGLVGESGSGKSVLSFAVLRILDAAARISAGAIHFAGIDMLKAAESDLEELRGRELAMIFQNPRVALNPIRAVGKQIEDVLRRHGPVRNEDLKTRALELLRLVRIADPERRYRAYPFELSGGQCQRVMIAIALACNPALLIADEPTTGLDVTTQAAIMDLVRELGQARKMATLLITHDLGLAAQYCDRIIVMHAGHVVESGPTAELFAAPHHPYTARLIASIPTGAVDLRALTSIPGGLPDLRREDLPVCRFRDRCDRRTDLCDVAPLPRMVVGAGAVACRHPLEGLRP